MSLVRRLERRIRQDGPLTAAEYMAACLHDPDDGYYATRPRLGAGGDFITAPLVSQMFGELIGLWAVEVWTRLGAPDRFGLVELGPGDGRLMQDALRAARLAPGFAAAAELWLVETSAPLRAAQGERLAAHAPRWAADLAEVPGGAPTIAIANELLDCLGARQFVRTDTGWAERRIGFAAGGGLTFGLSPAPAGFRPPPALAASPPGSLIEVSPAQEALGAAMGARIARDGGAALFIDYGRDRPETGDTLQALVGHQKISPLERPGEADLTVHADFPAVAEAARAAGASATPIVTQRAFLRALGVEQRAAALARARPDRAQSVALQLARLTDPGEMGELFKVVAIHAPGLDVPGFEQ